MKTRTYHGITALTVFAAGLILYLRTVSPTISFWDCPEFITTARIMGIPHPPGSPLLSLVGRVMSLVPFYDFRGSGLEHIAYRVNMINVLAGALTLLVTYLIAVALLKRIHPLSGMMAADWPVIFSAAVASMAAGMSTTFWDNAVETETYMPSLLLSLIALYLALAWEERKDEPRSILYLVCAAYVTGLGLGVHLSVLLIAPTVVLIAALARPEWFTDRRPWPWIAVGLAVVAVLRLFAGRGLFYLFVTLTAVAGTFIAHRLYRRERLKWRTILWAMLVCLSVSFVGYTVYGTVAIRAMKNPAINEGNPDTLTRFTDYLERKQYLAENMYAGMFDRKAEPGYQFGYMYARYLLKQAPSWGPVFGVTFSNDRSADFPGETVTVDDEVCVSILFWLIVLAGIVHHARRDPKRFLPLFLFFAANSAGLVVYLNMENPQVRERDYFFLGSFLTVWFWFGAGLFAGFEGIRALTSERFRGLKIPTMIAAVLATATIVPVSALSRHLDPDATNFDVHDRTGNVIALEYGRNILASCDENAVLFAHGDNDTYPLWYCQEVEGFRRDVRVVNLSLLNAPWHIKQLRDDPDNPLPIAFTDEFIDEKLCGNTLAAQRTRTWAAQPKTVTVAGLTWDMPPTISDGSRVGVLSVSAIMTAHIIEQVDWTRPVFFAVTVDPKTMIGLDRFMTMEGMVFRLTHTAAEGRYHVDSAVLDRNLFERYSYTGVADPVVYKDAETEKLLRNYFIGFVDLCEEYLNLGDVQNGVRAARAAMERCAPDLDRRILLESILYKGGATEEFERMMVDELARIPENNFDAAVTVGTRYLRYEMSEGARIIFGDLLKRRPRDLIARKGYAAALYQDGRLDETLEAIDAILELAPDDAEARQLRNIVTDAIQNGTPADSTRR